VAPGIDVRRTRSARHSPSRHKKDSMVARSRAHYYYYYYYSFWRCLTFLRSYVSHTKAAMVQPCNRCRCHHPCLHSTCSMHRVRTGVRRAPHHATNSAERVEYRSLFKASSEVHGGLSQSLRGFLRTCRGCRDENAWPNTFCLTRVIGIYSVAFFQRSEGNNFSKRHRISFG